MHPFAREKFDLSLLKQYYLLLSLLSPILSLGSLANRQIEQITKLGRIDNLGKKVIA